MPDHLVLPRLDAESVTTEQSACGPGPSMGRRAGFRAAANCLSEPVRGPNTPWPDRNSHDAGGPDYVLQFHHLECADGQPDYGFQVSVQDDSYYLVAVTFLTYSALTGPRGRSAPASGGPNRQFDLSPGWLETAVTPAPRPEPVKESPVIAKAAEDVDWETGLYQGQRGLNRDLQGSAGCRRRIAVR